MEKLTLMSFWRSTCRRVSICRSKICVWPSTPSMWIKKGKFIPITWLIFSPVLYSNRWLWFGQEQSHKNLKTRKYWQTVDRNL